jgi:O-methyltransferase
VIKRFFRQIGWRIHERLAWRLRHLGPDIAAADLTIIRQVLPYTMTSVERLLGLIDATRYLARAAVPGAIVERGVWRGGSMMAVAQALMDLGVTNRDLYLYDTFAGIPPATNVDRDWRGVLAQSYAELHWRRQTVWCGASCQEVMSNMRETGYPEERIHFVEGRVEETIPEEVPQEIALLRLDTDWYESTQHELEHLYPRLSNGGVLIVDDYGYWEGAQRAVDEYFRHRPALLVRLDSTARLAVKVT